VSKSVDLQGLVVRPVPPELLDKVVCTNCQENPARWDFGEKAEWNYTCSFCFLYKLKLLCDQRSKIDWLIRETEKVRGVAFLCHENGILSKEVDADCIAFAIVAGNKVFDARQQRLGGSR
jgi:hypothetical protein